MASLDETIRQQKLDMASTFRREAERLEREAGVEAPEPVKRSSSRDSWMGC